ncbi:MAG: tol-pal system-associated acyl-CoA thioesterase [Gammaproteobacteria bacterium]|nr:tol-pal system-associated acyl-CoA thioesterase [Gammaproteobacteria bacterium]
MSTDFHWPVRVYYEDTDHGGVVYYANYLKFMERARTEWLRARGVEQDLLARQEGVIFAVRSAQLDYLKPGRFNQLLSVSVHIAETGRASLTFDQTVAVADAADNKNTVENLLMEGKECGSVLCQGRIKIACLDASTLKPRAIPASIRQEILGDG